MDDELASEWFEKGERLAETVTNEVEAAPSPDLFARFRIALATTGGAAVLVITLVRVLA